MSRAQSRLQPAELDVSTSQIRTFCTVFELGSYAAAARNIGLSTSAIWEQVKELERQYATPLFARQGRQVVPTSAGQRLDELLRPLLAGLESTREVVLQESESWTGRITIATGVRMLIEEVGTALRVFQRQHPGVLVCIRQSDSRDAERLVASGEVDMALTLEPGPGYASKAVTLEPAYDIDYLLIAPSGHPLGKKGRIQLADLTKYPLVVPHHDTYSRHLVDQVLHHHGLTGSDPNHRRDGQQRVHGRLCPGWAGRRCDRRSVTWPPLQRSRSPLPRPLA